MKKSIFVLAGVAMLALASCKKDYTCECTTSVPGFTTESVSVVINDTKKKATAECEKGSGTVSLLGITSTTVCKIK